MADISDSIPAAAATPASATVDGQSVTGRSLDELIRADQYLANKAAGRGRTLPIRKAKLIPDGPT